MGFLKSGLPIPAHTLQSRRAIVFLSIISLVVLITLWDNFAPIAPYHRPPPGPPPGPPNDAYTPITVPPPRPHHGDGNHRPGGIPDPVIKKPTEESIASLTNSTALPPHRDPLCASHPDTGNIAVIMKTGATESFARLPTQFLTVLRCIDDFLVFSDKAQTVAGVTVHDALDGVLDEAKNGNRDFDLYRDQKTCEADQSSCTSGYDRAKAGWSLDKYKNIHMAEKAYRMLPDKDWYLFVDADTYVLWNTMVEWLGKLDPKEQLYLGSVAYVGRFPFSHGGSGYILSRAAMEAVVGKNPGLANKYDVKVKDVCCGDFMFSQAAKDVADIDVLQMWPTINGEKPFTLPFGPSHWCHPIATMHHMSTEEISTFWEFEAKHYSSSSLKPAGPMLMRDIHEAFFSPRLDSRRKEWDNLANDRFYLNFAANRTQEYTKTQLGRAVVEEKKSGAEMEAHVSFEHCRRACEADARCFQYAFDDGVCGFGFSMKLGAPVPGKGITAGWNVDKVKGWVGEHEKCEEVLWPKMKV